MRIKNTTIEHLWVLVVIGICFSYLCTQPIDQYDFWQHLKVGEIIFNTKKILDKDIFTFTIYGKHYIDMHWGVQLFYWLIYKIGRLELLIFTHAVLLTSAYILLFRLSLKTSNNIKTSAIATLISIILSLSNFALRPQAFSILLFTITFYLLKTNRLKFIPFIFLFWANLHSAFLVGLILICTHIFEGFDLKKKEFINPDIFSTLLISILFTIVNPFKLDLYSTALNVGPASSKVTHIMEWMPPSLNNETGIIFFSAIALLLILHLWKKLQWSITEIITFLIFTILALKWQRAVIWWGIITVPIFTRYLKEILPLNSQKETNKSEAVLNTTFASILIIYFISCLPWFKTNNPLVPKVKQNLIAQNTPIELSNKLKTLNSSKRIFNNFSWGSYFEWDLREDQKIFFDPKDFLYPPKIVKDYYTVVNGDTNWEEVLDSYKVDTVAIGKEEQPELIKKIRKSINWGRVYEDKLGYIFIKI